MKLRFGGQERSSSTWLNTKPHSTLEVARMPDRNLHKPTMMLAYLEKTGKLDETRSPLEANLKTVLSLSEDMAYAIRWMSNDKTAIPSVEFVQGFTQALKEDLNEANLSVYLANGMDRSMKDMFGFPLRPGNTLEQ